MNRTLGPLPRTSVYSRAPLASMVCRLIWVTISSSPVSSPVSSRDPDQAVVELPLGSRPVCCALIGSRIARSRDLSEEPVLEREKCRAGTGGDADLLVDVADVMVGRTGRDHQLRRHRFLGVPGTDQPQHGDLPAAQAGWLLGASTCPLMAGSGQDLFDGLTIQSTSRRVALQLPGAFFPHQGGPVGTRFCHCLVGVGGRHHSGRWRDVRRATAAVIARAIRALRMHRPVVPVRPDAVQRDRTRSV